MGEITGQQLLRRKLLGGCDSFPATTALRLVGTCAHALQPGANDITEIAHTTKVLSGFTLVS